MTKFLKWWLLFIVQLIMLFAAYHYGFLDYMWQHDITKISGIIILVWFFGSLNIGRLSYKAGKPVTELDEDVFADPAETSWFLSDRCFNLGLVGTAFGFLYMVHGLDFSGNLTDPGVIKNVISQLVTGLSTSMIATVVGMICGDLLKVQTYIFSKN